MATIADARRRARDVQLTQDVLCTGILAKGRDTSITLIDWVPHTEVGSNDHGSPGRPMHGTLRAQWGDSIFSMRMPID